MHQCAGGNDFCHRAILVDCLGVCWNPRRRIGLTVGIGVDDFTLVHHRNREAAARQPVHLTPHKVFHVGVAFDLDLYLAGDLYRVQRTQEGRIFDRYAWLVCLDDHDIGVVPHDLARQGVVNTLGVCLLVGLPIAKSGSAVPTE